jgi:hypothetical protein
MLPIALGSGLLRAASYLMSFTLQGYAGIGKYIGCQLILASRGGVAHNFMGKNYYFKTRLSLI